MIIRRVDESTYLRVHSEHLEIITRDRITGDTPCRITPAQSRLTISIKAGDLAKSGVALPIIFKGWIRRGEFFAVRPGFEAKLVEILRVVHIQRVQQDRIDYSEDEDVRTDAQHQSEKGYEHKRWRFAKHPQRIPNIR